MGLPSFTSLRGQVTITPRLSIHCISSALAEAASSEPAGLPGSDSAPGPEGPAEEPEQLPLRQQQALLLTASCRVRRALPLGGLGLAHPVQGAGRRVQGHHISDPDNLALEAQPGASNIHQPSM